LQAALCILRVPAVYCCSEHRTRRADSELHRTIWIERLDQWFPNGVSRHPGVSGGTTRCVAKLKKYLN
jgi:hypothetical protein